MKYITRNIANVLLAFGCLAVVGLAAIPSDCRPISFGESDLSPQAHVTCGSHGVSVDAAGVDADSVYACANDAVQWTSKGADFTISFQNPPWGASAGLYRSSGNPPTVTSRPFPACTSASSCDYKYTLEIGGKTYDPHVIIVP